MPDQDVTRARERLEGSRQRLLAHMRGEIDPEDDLAVPAVASDERPQAAPDPDSPEGEGRLTFVAALRRRIEANPVGAVLIDTGQMWWERHPMRAVLLRAKHRLDASTAPFVREHPVLSVALAASLGGALAATRPWHDERVLRVWRPVQGHLGGWLRAQFPTQALIHAAVTALATRAMSPSVQETAQQTAQAAVGAVRQEQARSPDGPGPALAGP